MIAKALPAVVSAGKTRFRGKLPRKRHVMKMGLSIS